MTPMLACSALYSFIRENLPEAALAKARALISTRGDLQYAHEALLPAGFKPGNIHYVGQNKELLSHARNARFQAYAANEGEYLQSRDLRYDLIILDGRQHQPELLENIVTATKRKLLRNNAILCALYDERSPEEQLRITTARTMAKYLPLERMFIDEDANPVATAYTAFESMLDYFSNPNDADMSKTRDALTVMITHILSRGRYNTEASKIVLRHTYAGHINHYFHQNATPCNEELVRLMRNAYGPMDLVNAGRFSQEWTQAQLGGMTKHLLEQGLSEPGATILPYILQAREMDSYKVERIDRGSFADFRGRMLQDLFLVRRPSDIYTSIDEIARISPDGMLQIFMDQSPEHIATCDAVIEELQRLEEQITLPQRVQGLSACELYKGNGHAHPNAISENIAEIMHAGFTHAQAMEWLRLEKKTSKKSIVPALSSS
jgi:hypothetical protein